MNARSRGMGAGWLPLLGLLALVGCRGARPEIVDFSEKPRNFLPRDYGDVYDTWTRHGRAVSGEGLEIEVWATLKSWEFREAYIEKYTDVYHHDADQKAALRGSELEAAREVFEIHMAVQMNDHRGNNLDRRDTQWRIALVDGAGDALPAASVERSPLPVQYEATFFPGRTDFTTSYVVRFPRGDGAGGAFGGAETGQVILRIAGPRATVEMEWNAN